MFFLSFFLQMTFEVSSSVTLLFDFWDVHGPAGKSETVRYPHFIGAVHNTVKSYLVVLKICNHMIHMTVLSQRTPLFVE